MSLVDLIFPKKCINCRKLGEFICPQCFGKIAYNDNFQCSVCMRSAINCLTHPGCQKPLEIDGVVAITNYNNIVKRLIYQFKNNPHVSKLAGIISRVLIEGLEQNEGFYNFVLQNNPTLIPIPLSQKRLRERGYNHAELLASYVAKYYKLKLNSKALVQVKDTKPQSKLSKKDRIENVRNAFGINKNLKLPENVVLIDDIATSFATLREAAKVLKQKGVKKVLGVTFAREI